MKPISNPYAKKATNSAQSGVSAPPPRNPTHQQNPSRPPPAAATGVGRTNNSNRNAAFSSIPHIPVPRATTFSQAFESMEDSGSSDSQQQQQQQGQQSASIPQPNMSERDHHVLLQQPHVLYASTKQRGNGVLDYIRNVPVQYHTMVPDYIFSSTGAALFLSIRYHNLYPEYIYRRIAALGKDFTLRVLLVLVDVDDNAAVLLHLNKAAVTHNLTLVLAWSEEEAARYLETYKALDGKDSSVIQKAKDSTHLADQVTDVLTVVKGVNKTDAASVLTQFGSVAAAMAASPDELGLISGLGEVKVKRLHNAFHKPFSSKAARERKQKKREAEKANNDDEDENDGEEEYDGDLEEPVVAA